MSPQQDKPPVRWQVYAGVNADTGEWQWVKVGPTAPADARAKRLRVKIAGRSPAGWVAEFEREPTLHDITALDPTVPPAVEA